VNLVRLVLVTILLGGCTWHGDFSAVASKNVNLDDMRIDRSLSKGRVAGKDCQHIVILIPTGGPPTLEEAVDRAVEPVNANLLTDASVDFYYFYIPLIYGQSCWLVEGDAYDTFESS